MRGRSVGRFLFPLIRPWILRRIHWVVPLFSNDVVPVGRNRLSLGLKECHVRGRAGGFLISQHVDRHAQMQPDTGTRAYRQNTTQKEGVLGEMIGWRTAWRVV